MNPGCRVQDQLNTSEPTTPHIIGRELNLRKLPGRQWESIPQPSEQLQPMAIKTSASTETATIAYYYYSYYYYIALYYYYYKLLLLLYYIILLFNIIIHYYY